MKTFSQRRTDPSRVAKIGQTAAHLRYICRPSAARVVLECRLSGGHKLSAARIAEKAAEKRKGRVCERFVIALPVEATTQQRTILAQTFADRLSNGIAGYVAAIHDKNGNDLSNPHAHLVFFDKYKSSGGRGRPKSTLGLARKNAIQTAAKLWSDTHNELMRQWGYGSNSHISHLSYADRGIDQVPTIHEGAAIRAKPEIRKVSKPAWIYIDQGHSRSEANNVIREINKLKRMHCERADRLGKVDESHGTECQFSFAQQRECSSGNGEALRQDRPSFSDDKRNGIDDHKSFRPQFVEGGRGRSRGRFQKPGGPNFPFGNSRGGLDFRRRSSLRRIFRELIFLRDTLRAKLRPTRSHIILDEALCSREINRDLGHER